MKVYNKEKTIIIEEYDLETGYLKEDILETVIPAIEGIEEEGHLETIAEYENGGKDVKWVVDVAGVEAHEERIETENILVYIPYTQEQLEEFNRLDTIFSLKTELKKIKEDVEQVELFGMERTDFETKKQRCIEIIYQLRGLEIGK